MTDGTPNLAYGVDRLFRFLSPPVTVTEPPRDVVFERDVPAAMRDGTTLRVNVFRPAREGRYPVIMSAHPYGKDELPKRGVLGYGMPILYRIMRQPSPVSFSAWTSWEAPDPAFWVPRGYVVVNCDLRGSFRSDGEGSVLSDAEANDYYDLIEWAARQPWSTGRVGLNGVSYLALSQWKVAALAPPHLAAICPWEGFSDLYRDLAYPGGIREDGFIEVWSAGVKKQPRHRVDPRKEQLRRPLWDAWWASCTAELERIEVPALICGSFSDHNLHSRGSIEAFQRISSKHRWLYTHRGPKWATYYSAEALAFQARFFDCFLKGEENGMREEPPVRLEVRDTGDLVREVRGEAGWPLPRTRWTPLYLHGDGALREAAAPAAAELPFDPRKGRLSFTWPVPEDIELIGPMKLTLHVEVWGADDVHLFAGIRKLRDGKHVVFHGSYGFGHDMVTKGWLKASHRRLDAQRSTPYRPFHCHDRAEPLAAGEIVRVEIALLPSSTFFRKGDVVRLDIQGRWFFKKNPFTGQFPPDYEPSPPGTCVIHCGGAYDAHLLVPVIPGDPAR